MQATAENVRTLFPDTIGQAPACAERPASQALQTVTRLAAVTLDAPLAVLWAVDGDGTRQARVASDGAGARLEGLAEGPLCRALLNEVIQRERPLVIGNAGESALVRALPAMPDFRLAAFLGVPILTGSGQAAGALCVCSPDPRRWTARGLSVMTDLAACAGDDMALRETVRGTRHRAEALDAAYRTATREAALLQTLTLSATAPELTVEARLAELLRACALGLGFETATLAQVDGEGVEVILSHPDEADAPVRHVADLSGLPAAAALGGTGLVERPDLRQEPALRPRDLGGRLCLRHVGIPLTVKGLLYGMLEFGAPEPAPPLSEAHLSVLSLAASLACGQLGALSEIRALRRSESALLSYLLDQRSGSA